MQISSSIVKKVSIGDITCDSANLNIRITLQHMPSKIRHAMPAIAGQLSRSVEGFKEEF